MNELENIQAQLAELVNRERWDQAGRELPAAFAIDPDNFRNHILAGIVAVEQEDIETARRHAEKALSANPVHFDGLFLLYRVQQATGDLAAAENTLLEMLALYPHNAALHAQYADLMLSTLHVGRARELAREALRLQPDLQSATIIEILADVVEGHGKAARERLATLIKRNPENQEVAMALAVVLHKERRYLEAMDVMRGVLRANPGDVAALDWVIGLAARAHWTGIPCWPVMRYGFAGKMFVYLGGITAVKLAAVFASDLVDPFALAIVVFAYLLYIIVQPALMQRWIRARGIT